MALPTATGDIGEFSLSSSSKINPFVWMGFKWGADGAGTPATVTYSFPPAGAQWDLSVYNRPYADNEPMNGFQPFDANQEVAARAALQLWSNVANITFNELDEIATPNDVGDIRFGNSNAVSQSDSAAWAYTPYEDGVLNYPENGDIWFDYNYGPNLELQPGEFGFSTMLHEIGHALGLDHPFPDGDGEPVLPAAERNQRYSIMAYDTYAGATIEAYGPMLYDILAIQYIYGANMTWHDGNDVYQFAPDKEYLECIWDAGGHDTIDLSNQTRNQIIDLREGTFSSIGTKNNATRSAAVGNVAIAFGVTIEDAVGGSGHDKITGNDVANDLDGKAGNDTIAGGAGSDTLTGGTGNDSMSGGKDDDLYFVDSALDKVIELAGEGSDTVKSTVSYSFAAAPNVERLELVGAGNLNGTGNASANTILGNDGNNVLDGGGGADTLTGGIGNDTYILDNVGDVVTELGADTGDTVKSSALALTAFAGIENYIFTGTKAFTFAGDGVANLVSGGSSHDTIDGAGGNDTLLGNGGNDSLTGGTGDDLIDGGSGNDKMDGGSGNDTYVINAAGDTITGEQIADTEDLVKSSVTVNLAILASGLIDHAILTGTAAIHATGNGEDNELIGNNAGNKLDGGGGADFLDGGKGADIYTVDDAGDTVLESFSGAAGGIDLVNSSVSFILDPNVEKLTLTGNSSIDGTGNTLANTIIGNDGDNRLDGDVGNDAMTGGKGSDTYVVDSAKDVVKETVANNKGGGVDTVESAVTFTLATRVYIENLTLTGTGDINGTGNALANTILGNSGRNILDGGTGADVLEGGAGNDTYMLDNAGDTVDEGANTDTGDEVKTKATIASAFAGIENYSYTGTKAWSFTGTTDANRISGGSISDALNGGQGNDTLLGNSGNDTLAGNEGDDGLDGGTGNDKMLGGAGNDTYVVNAAGDSINEEGHVDTDDLVKSSVSVSLVTLGAGAIEHALLLGASAINATGNNSSNELTGNGGANKLDGGAGADTMTGGNGADTYTVDDAGDLVVETSGTAAGGIDTVLSSIDYTLTAFVEKLTLTGTDDIDGTGNTLNNTLLGNDGANVLDGLGGNDTMTGGKGDDTYIVESAKDVVNETIANNKGGGIDTVESAVTFSLATRVNIENLTLTADSTINGTGNALNNLIVGSDGNNRLDGGTGNDVLQGGLGIDTLIGGTGTDLLSGGDEADILTGGSGSDTFDYNTLNEIGDTITDFVKGIGGDILNLADLLDVHLGVVGDAFAGGYLQFATSAGNTQVQIDQDGGGNGFVTYITLANVSLAQTDTANLVLTSA